MGILLGKMEAESQSERQILVDFPQSRLDVVQRLVPQSKR